MVGLEVEVTVIEHREVRYRELEGEEWTICGQYIINY